MSCTLLKAIGCELDLDGIERDHETDDITASTMAPPLMTPTEFMKSEEKRTSTYGNCLRRAQESRLHSLEREKKSVSWRNRQK